MIQISRSLDVLAGREASLGQELYSPGRGENPTAPLPTKGPDVTTGASCQRAWGEASEGWRFPFQPGPRSCHRNWLLRAESSRGSGARFKGCMRRMAGGVGFFCLEVDCVSLSNPWLGAESWQPPTPGRRARFTLGIARRTSAVPWRCPKCGITTRRGRV
jgi:hypothetical protein